MNTSLKDVIINIPKNLKIIVFILFVIYPLVTFSQEYKWGDWKKSACYKGVYFRVKFDGHSYDNFYRWYVQFQNTYTENIDFYYDFYATEYESNNNEDGHLMRLKPKQIEERVAIIKNNKSVWVSVSGLTVKNKKYNCDNW